MQEKIIEAVQQAKIGSRKVRITFKEDVYPNDILSLIAMCSGDHISMSHDSELALRVCALMCGWEYDRQRTMVIAFADDFDEGRFIEVIQRNLENIGVAE